MALILLALGVVMSLVGLAAMATGYPMIEIERGWASVITGAILLSGGLVVVSLGLVVRHLVGLRGALSAVGALSQPTEAPVPQPVVVPTPPTPAPARPSMPAAAQLELPQPAAPAATAIPIAAAALAAGSISGHDARDATHLMPEAARHPHETLADLHDATNAVQAPDHAAHQEPPYREELHRGLPYQEEPHQAEPLPQEPDPVAAAAPEPPLAPEERGAARGPKTTEDLLDEAFSAFDYEMANGHTRSTEAVPEAAHAPLPAAPPLTVATEVPPEPVLELAAHEPVHEPVHEHVHEPVHEPPGHLETHPETDEHQIDPPDHEHAEAPTQPAEPAPDLAVIGRYDSEGTSYVMYSDGSIEAQSEAGVYRFGSMAELKAFIEG